MRSFVRRKGTPTGKGESKTENAVVTRTKSCLAIETNSGSGGDDDEPTVSCRSRFLFREIIPQDKATIQALHEEWFPVTYQDEFYDDLSRKQYGPDRQTLYTQVAVLRNDEEAAEEIAACVVGTFVEAKRLSERMQALLLSDRQKFRRGFYVMTLGTATEYRQAGLATRLVQMCMRQVQDDPTCGVMYLHVLTTNVSAIQLYENLGFYRVQEIVDYYSIEGQLRPCYLYAKYFHGNRGHRDMFYLVKDTLVAFWTHVLTLPITFLLRLTKGSKPGQILQQSRSS